MFTSIVLWLLFFSLVVFCALAAPQLEGSLHALCCNALPYLIVLQVVSFTIMLVFLFAAYPAQMLCSMIVLSIPYVVIALRVTIFADREAADEGSLPQTQS